MLVAVVNIAILFAVPPVVVTSEVLFPTTAPVAVGAAARDAAPLALALPLALPPPPPPPPPPPAATCTNALAGNPPNVSASPAFSAYGALTKSVRACSPSCSTCTPIHRACPDANNSAGNPSAFVDPSSTV